MSLDERNAELDQALEHNPIDEQIASLTRADLSRKRQVRWLAISLILDVLLTIGFGYTTIRANNAASKAESSTHAIIRNCETSNEARANNKKLWDYIINLPPTQPPTSEQQKRIADFKKFIDMTFAPRDCSKAVDNQGL